MIYFLYLLNWNSSFDVLGIQFPAVSSPGSTHASRDYHCKDMVCIGLRCKQHPRNIEVTMSEVLLLGKFTDPWLILESKS